MERNKLQPLTEREKRFIMENHNIVYSFLMKYGYSIEEYYNIAIFGLIKSAQVYCRRKDLQERFSFFHIAYQYMRAEMSNHFKRERATKRKPVETIISLDADYTEKENLYNCTGGKSFEMDIMMQETLKELLKNLTEVQRKITEMKLEGYSNKETYVVLRIKPSTYYKELQRIKTALEKVLY